MRTNHPRQLVLRRSQWRFPIFNRIYPPGIGYPSIAHRSSFMPHLSMALCVINKIYCTSTNGAYIATAQIPKISLQPKTSTKFGETKLAWGPGGIEKNKQTWNQVWTQKKSTTTQWCFSDASLQRPRPVGMTCGKDNKAPRGPKVLNLGYGPSQRNSRSNLQNCRRNLLIVEVTNSSARESGVFFNQQLGNSKQQKWERTCPKCGKSLLTPLFFSRDPWYMVSLFFFLVLSGLSVMKFCTSYEVFSW